jgi:hypothetical protein
VHNAGPRRVITARGGEPEQAMHKGASRMTARRMYDQSGWLINDKQVRVLIGNPKDNAWVGDQLACLMRAQVHLNDGTVGHHIAFAWDDAIHQHAPVENQALCLCPAANLIARAHKDIDTGSHICGFDNKPNMRLWSTVHRCTPMAAPVLKK